MNLPPRLSDEEFEAAVENSMIYSGSVYVRPIFELIDDNRNAGDFHESACWPEPNTYHTI